MQFGKIIILKNMVIFFTFVIVNYKLQVIGMIQILILKISKVCGEYGNNTTQQ